MNDTPKRVTFTVYTRHGCHLCEDLLMQLHQLQNDYDFNFSPVDVDASTELAEQYGLLVPVVELEGKQICHYFLDQAALIQALGSSNN